jgi:hypothetical protein
MRVAAQDLSLAQRAPPARALPKPPTLPAPGPAPGAALQLVKAEQAAVTANGEPEPIKQIPAELGAFINSLPPSQARAACLSLALTIAALPVDPFSSVIERTAFATQFIVLPTVTAFLRSIRAADLVMPTSHSARFLLHAGTMG